MSEFLDGGHALATTSLQPCLSNTSDVRRWDTKDGTKGLCVFFPRIFCCVVLETHQFSAVPSYSATLSADNTTPNLEDKDLLLGVEGGMWPVELTFGFT